MSISEMIIPALILAGVVYLLYRSLWKRKGTCHGCSGGCCGVDKKLKAGNFQ
mgnify:CR=1 FL=1